MDKLSSDADFIRELFGSDERQIDQALKEESFYNPISNQLESKDSLLGGDYRKRSDEIQQWIEREESRIRFFSGYDGIEPFIALARETLEMMNTHSIEVTDKKMTTKVGNDNSTVIMQQFDEMKSKHPDAILLFRRGGFYETYKEDAVKSATVLGIETTDRIINGIETKVARFQHHALDTYLPKLIRSGNRVAICEELEAPKRKKPDKEFPETETQSNDKDMPRKKKEKTPEQEQPKSEVKNEVTAKAKTEKKQEAKAETKKENQNEQTTGDQQERKPREPQMVTVNGQKVTHGHAYQSNVNPNDWYFTAKLDGQQLKPQKMTPEDLALYRDKQLTVPQLMERYYPTKLMPKVPESAYQVPNVLTGPEGNLTVDKFNVYKEKNEERQDFGKYKFYVQIGDKKMSAVAPREDLNAYFDRVRTPGQLVEKNFGERLHLQTHYQQFQLPDGVDPKGIRIAKDRGDDKWKVSVDLGERGRTSKKELSFDDGYSLFKSKTATREQIAAKYLGDEIKTTLSQPMAAKESRGHKI